MDFRFRENTEHAEVNNKGHVTHRIDLHVGGKGNSGGENAFRGEEIGYISVTYIPSEEWEKRYTGDWGLVRWLSDFKGTCGLTESELVHDDSGDVVGVSEWLHKDLPKTVRTLSQRVEEWSDWLSESDVEEMTEAELEMAFDYYTDELWDKHEEEYEASRRFHVDKPRVEYIRVAEPHRRNGYGTALYKRMTEELDRRFGLSLHDGGTQSDAAEAAWEKLVTLDWNEATTEEHRKLATRGLRDDETFERYKLSVKTETKQAA